MPVFDQGDALPPVFEAEAGDAGELVGVVRDEHEIVREGGGGDEEVEGTDTPSRSFEFGAGLGVDFDALLVEREFGEAGEEVPQGEQVALASSLECAEKEFATDDGRDCECGIKMGAEAVRGTGVRIA